MRARLRGARALNVALTPESARAAGGADIVVTSAAQSPDGWRCEFETPLGPARHRVAAGRRTSTSRTSRSRSAWRSAAASTATRSRVGLARLGGVPGRLERVANARGVLCLVDYAHTPDALERAIAAVRPLTAGRVVVVFGCGGDRDNSKRPLMGQIAARDADLAIVTSDNPRTEEPESILDMIVAGVRRETIPELDAAELPAAARGYHREVDRRTAIRRAAAACRSGDVLLIAGKGTRTTRSSARPRSTSTIAKRLPLRSRL